MNNNNTTVTPPDDDMFIQKLSDLTGIPVPFIREFRSAGMMDNKGARDAVLRDDYHRLRDSGIDRERAVTILSEFYGIGSVSIKAILKLVPKRVLYCRRCGAEITAKKHEAYGGLCPSCYAHEMSGAV